MSNPYNDPTEVQKNGGFTRQMTKEEIEVLEGSDTLASILPFTFECGFTVTEVLVPCAICERGMEPSKVKARIVCQTATVAKLTTVGTCDCSTLPTVSWRRIRVEKGRRQIEYIDNDGNWTVLPMGPDSLVRRVFRWMTGR